MPRARCSRRARRCPSQAESARRSRTRSRRTPRPTSTRWSRTRPYTLDRALTPEDFATTYNNYYEFGSFKQIWQKAQALKIRPWTVEFDGLVEEPMTVAIDDLLAQMPLEERLYRHRCVEAWSIAVPYSGFPLKALVDFRAPARRCQVPGDADLRGRRGGRGPEAVLVSLALHRGPHHGRGHQRALLHRHRLLRKSRSRSRTARRSASPCPWKYGFKHIKGIVRFTFTDERPKSFWEDLAGNEYGFWANVNPEVPHPRWSQAHERFYGPDGQERLPTLLYNGYGEQVASLYDGMENELIFM